jgi:hypothetical protein
VLQDKEQYFNQTNDFAITLSGEELKSRVKSDKTLNHDIPAA